MRRLQVALAHQQALHSEVEQTLRIELETLDAQSHWPSETLDWYTDLYELAPIAYLALDANGLVRDINLTGASLLGSDRQHMVGRPLRLHVHPDDRRKFHEHLRRTRLHDRCVSELRILGSGGAELPSQLISRRSSAATGPTLRTVIVDLGERARMESDLLFSKQRLELALLASEAGLYEYVWPHTRLWVSPRWSEILGRPTGEVVTDESLWTWLEGQIDPADREARSHARSAFLAREKLTYSAEFRLRRVDGAPIWAREIAHAAQRGPDGRPTRVLGVLLDITAHKQRLAEAERRTEQVRELSAALFRVEENERRELSALLHDDLGQRLVAARMHLGALARRAGAPELASGLEAVGAALDAAQETVRSLSFQLSPPILHDLGLVAGLRWLARELTATWNLEVEIDDDGPLPPLPGNPTFLLFRCVRELLINVAKHAGVPEAKVVLRCPRGAPSLQIVVEDHGVGFHPAQLAAERLERRSFGLLSVQERIKGIGGRVLIDSAPGIGTQVILLIPRDDESGPSEEFTPPHGDESVSSDGDPDAGLPKRSDPWWPRLTKRGRRSKAK